MTSSRSFVITCPNDQAPMEKVAVRGFTVDRCTACRSLWFDAVELQKALAIKGAAASLDAPPDDHAGARHPDPAGGMKCPRCQSPLVSMTDQAQAHVRMQGCTVCGGVLLARGALLDLGEFTLAERVRGFLRLS